MSPGASLDAETLRAELAEDRPPHAGPWSQSGVAIVAGLVGLAGLIGSLALGLGRLTQPGPGLWPFVVSVVVTVLSAVLAVVGRPGTDTEKFSRASVLTAVAIGTLVVFAGLLPVIGSRSRRCC
ncbi:tripartite tricarboxylate transporter TctB family protein [Kribbella sp. NPDC048928]|uniref:tripartite tricarboxylate transporter TctB family protein n=1 Tax=Kribbella sp. NPDC048928 TaxID=3364111 RepID=UPI003718A905